MKKNTKIILGAAVGFVLMTGCTDEKNKSEGKASTVKSESASKSADDSTGLAKEKGSELVNLRLKANDDTAENKIVLKANKETTENKVVLKANKDTAENKIVLKANKDAKENNPVLKANKDESENNIVLESNKQEN